MGQSPVAARRHVDLARIGFGISDELGNGPGRKRWIDLHDEWRAHDAGDRRDVADEIETELVVKRGIARVCRRDQEEGVTVSGRAHYHLGSDIAGGAWPVLNNEWMTKPLRQPLTDQAPFDVGPTTGRITPVSYTHLRAHETRHDLVCRLLLE